MVGLESMSRYVSPVNPAIYPHLTLVLMSIGVLFTAWFFVYEVTSTKLTRDFFKECLIALVASIMARMNRYIRCFCIPVYTVSLK
ncbi:hypothetical protein Pmani_033786 [Petrolisthes manimaculis]|uniref:Dolichyl-diphosphooligosaccharide-protein glycosyltransferase subunit TMEM258 n=1 Tax=Petrolisthes manimaculis TaxID=1843537 RepID=A0AAE1NPU1_9EUCA|nr:hypothetical protein Pmani_033786 [Petrolisthes manimaculis]